jgi:putative transposase
MGKQVAFEFPQGWGGARRGAGRKRGVGRRAGVPHRRREGHRGWAPVHVTLRGAAGLPSFRAPRMFQAIKGALAAASGVRFRVVQFSVQSDHLHLMVEGDDGSALRSGLRGLTIRTAMAINKAVRRRGRVWGDRYHAHALTSPAETRRALVYILFNFRKHRPADGSRIDACSSGPWFGGFRAALPATSEARPVCPPVTWLARAGWRRAGGEIRLDERPAAAAKRH